MRIKTLLTTLLVMFAAVGATAQIESGKVYRIVNSLYGTVAAESAIDNTVKCETVGTSIDYQQMWIITETATEGLYTVQNVYTGRNLHFQNAREVPFYTVDDEDHTIYINDNSAYFSGRYTFTDTKNRTWGMHCNSGSVCVPWNTDAEGTNWYFFEVSITEEQIATARATYTNFKNAINNEEEYAAAFEPFFNDKACTELKAEYAAMSDADFVTAIASLPADLQQIALKIKTNTWNTEKREKEFRIYDYKPHSDPVAWAGKLYLRYFDRLNNPTGICTVNTRSYVYVFVDQIPEDSYIDLAEMKGTFFHGTDTRLHEGLNIVPSANTDGFLYIRYVCETDTAGKKLADFPDVKIHIENGYVNGFWSKERGHTNEDWLYMQEYMFENEEAIQAMGDHSLLNFRKKEFLAYNACPENIAGLMSLWDFWNVTQKKYMNLDKYAPWFNNKQLAMSDDNGFMDASNYRTHYNNNTLSTIANYDRLVADAGSTWGPNHEIGHTNQYAFQIVGTSEVCNNALANMVIFDIGTHVSRGNNMTNQILDFENKVPYVVRGEKAYGSKLFSMTRMYYQLYLYAHAAGKCPTFYQQLFERLRYDRLIGWGTRAQDDLDENGYYIGSMDAQYDQLKFAEICCEILQMDLSEFFEAWGFFIPMKNAAVGDYGHHYVYLHQEDIDASRARMQQYEKKGGHLMFLEDRVRPSKRLDGTGYRRNYASWDGETIGTVGDFGQWEDYIDESVKAEGYYYTNTNGKIFIKEADGAKGALGFKLYDADTNELLTFTNKKSMGIPVSATGAKLKVVAAQADGTDYIIPSAAEGPVDMQLEALKNSIVQATNVLSYTTDGGEVGKYITDSVATLQSLYNEAMLAYKNQDTSVNSFADWSSMLDNEYNSIVNNEKARITMKEGVTYYMFNSGRGSYFMTGSGLNMIGSTSTNNEFLTNVSKHWTLEYSGTPGEYVLKNLQENRYVASMISDDNIYLGATDPEQGINVKVNYTANGCTYFTKADDTSLAIGIANGSSPACIAISPNSSNAQWRVYELTDNSAEFESNEIADLMDEAKFLLEEVSNLDTLAVGDTVTINKNIMSNDILLQDYVKALYDTYASVNMENTGKYYDYIKELREGIYNMEDKYSVTSPTIATNDGIFYWYAIKSDVSTRYWAIQSNGRLALVDDSDDVEKMLWAAIPGENPGEYRLLNASTKTCLRQYKIGPILQGSYSVSSNADDVPVTFEYNSEDEATIIYTGSGSAAIDTGTATFVSRSTKSTSGWHFELVAVEQDEELFHELTGIDDIVVDGVTGNENTYDLFGRKIQAPMKNSIYIKGNKKIIAE